MTMNVSRPVFAAHVPVSFEMGARIDDAAHLPAMSQPIEMDESHPGQPARQGALANAQPEDSAEYSDTEHELGAYDEVMSAQRLRSALTRDLARISLGGDHAPALDREPSPPVVARAPRDSVRAWSAPSKLDRSSVEAQEVGVGDSAATAARAIGQKRSAESRDGPAPPSSPGKKIRNALRRMMPGRGDDKADDLLGKSAPW